MINSVHADFAIRSISAEDTILLRWPILRAGMQREDAIFPGDDAADTQHFGAFHGEKLVGVVTIFPAQMPQRPDLAGTWQLRGMATSPEVRGAGCGKGLLDACKRHVLHAGGALLWCNARLGAQAFYARHGWSTIGDTFEIPTAGPHVRMMLELS